MNISKGIMAIDTHTMGEPTRIIIGGIPFIKGESLLKKREYLLENLDYIRTSVIHEPRGHNDMFGAIVTESIDPEADFGVFFMDGKGYIDMCGHGSMGVATAMVEYGMVPVKEPFTNIYMETLAGIVEAKVNVIEGKAKSVSIRNVPSFVYKKDYIIEVPEIGRVSLDISFGGNFFAIVNAKEIGIEVKRENIDRLIKIGIDIKKIINDVIEVEHPINTQIKSIELVEIYDDSQIADLKNIVIFGNGQYDRSPCGTGTSAKLATMYKKGLKSIGDEFTYESILGTIFKGKIVDSVKVGDYDAIIPEITGESFITGFNQIFIDPKDPFKYGFNIH